MAKEITYETLKKRVEELEKEAIECKVGDKKIERLNLVLRTIRNVNQLLFKERYRDRLLRGVCENLTENRGYYSAWIALFYESGGLITTAETGLGDDFLPMIEKMRSGDFTFVCRKALAQSNVLLIEDPLSSCIDCPLSTKYSGRGGMSVRLEHNGKVYGMLSVSIPKDVVTDKEEIGLLEEIAGDIAFGLYSMELEEEHKRADEALRANEKKLSQIVQVNSIPTFVIDNKHIITHWNNACENLTDIGSGEIVGTHKQWSAFYSNERPVLADLIVDNASEEEIPNYYEEEFRKSEVIDGGYEAEDFFPSLGEKGRWLFFTAAPLRDSEGKITGAIETLQDISDRKQGEEELKRSERRFRDLIENSLTGISIVQEDKIVYQNPEQERLFGPLPRSFIFTDLEGIHPDDVQKVKQFYKKVSSGKVRTLDMDFRFYPIDKAGSRIDMKWVYCRTSLIEYQGKEAILVNMIDVTRAKELEDDLRTQDKMSSLGRVAAGIAHEIRNPLSGINIYLSTLEKIYDREDSLENIKQILGQLQSASNKIESIIRRVMDFSKPSAPKFLLTDLNKPIEEAIKLSAVTLRKSGIKIKKSLAENLPPCHVDTNLIEQVILNLITNASEAMKNVDSDKMIEVSTSLENNRIIIRISDSGLGVPSNIKEKIFEPFYTTKSESTGIGLSLSHRIITDHGGSLEVSSSKWGGAEFMIEIPVEKGTDKR